MQMYVNTYPYIKIFVQFTDNFYSYFEMMMNIFYEHSLAALANHVLNCLCVCNG